MTSIALGIFIVGIIYVMIWSLKNDGARSIGEQTGFIRMRVPSKTAQAIGKQPRGRGGNKSPTPTSIAKRKLTGRPQH